MTTTDGMVVLGAVGGAHGVKGQFRIKTFTAKETDIAAYGPLTTEKGATLHVKVIRVAKAGLVLAAADEIKAPEHVKELTGQKLYVDRDRLPPPEDDDEFYIEDLVGLRAETPDGAPAGRVAAVEDFGAGELLELRGIPNVKGARLIRFTRELVPVVDISGGRIVLSPDAFDLGEGEPEPTEDC